VIVKNTFPQPVSHGCFFIPDKTDISWSH